MAPIYISAAAQTRTRPHLPTQLLRWALLLLLALAVPGLTGCEDDDSATETPVPDRTPYTGEWFGPLTWVGLGPADNAVVSLRAPASSADVLEGSFVYAPTMERRTLRAQWNRQQARWDVTFSGTGATERNGSLSLTGNSLKLDFETSNGRYTTTMTDARDLWAGNWQGTLSCTSGAARNVSWTVRKATSSRFGLEIANASAPTTVIAQGELTESALTGSVPIAGVAHTYALDYIYFTQRLRLNATAPGNDACSTSLSR